MHNRRFANWEHGFLAERIVSPPLTDPKIPKHSYKDKKMLPMDACNWWLPTVDRNGKPATLDKNINTQKMQNHFRYATTTSLKQNF